MFKRTKVCTGVLAALGATLLAGAIPSFAQQPQRIEITGSLIRRIEGETALPVTTLRVDDLARAGATNAEQAVTFITQQQGGAVATTSVSGTQGAASYVDLRSLGNNRTLVLLNGRRVVSNPFASAAVDLNTLPTGALERIETLSDGASSTYGTDAIAGVVNFITRRTYTGFSVSAQAQVTEEGGGNVYTGNLMGGFGDLARDGWNVFAAFNYRDQKPLGGTERDFMRSAYIPSQGFNGTSPTTFPANYSNVSGTLLTNPTLASGCLPETSIPVPEANGTTIRCFADTQAFTQVVPIQEQWGAFVKGSLALGASNTLGLEYFKSFNKIQSRIAPSPEGGLQMFPNSPFFPGRGITPGNAGVDPAQPININWRTTALGSRSNKQENDTQRAVLSLEGSAMDWDYTASLLWSNSFVENFFLNGYPQTQPLRNGVRGCSVALVANVCPAGSQTPFLNPFGDQTAAGLAYLQSIQVLGSVQTGEGTVQSASGQVSRSFGRLPGGAIGVALQAEVRQEEMVYNTDIAKVSQAASSGLAGSGAVRQGDRDIEAVGVEVSLPLSRSLEVNLSVRHDRYSDFGNTTNPKFAIRFRPTDMVLLRGSINSGFSAPTLTALYAPNSTTFTATRYNDPVLCPGGVVSGGVATRDCGQQFQRLQGGNTQLKAEESSAWTVGFLVQPTAAFSFGADYWSYRIHDSVSTVGEQSIFGDPAKYSALFVRCSQAPAERRALVPGCQQAGPGDALAYVVDTNANLGDVKTEGIDIQVNYNTGATTYGRFGATLKSSYVRKYHFQTEPGGAFFDPLGTYNPQFAGPVLRYQQVTLFNWERDLFSVLVANRFRSGYRDQNTIAAPFSGAAVVSQFNQNRVNSYSQWDLSASVRPIKGLTVTGGVLNVFDRDPPFSNQTSRFQARGYDDRFYSPLGRTYQVSGKYEF